MQLVQGEKETLRIEERRTDMHRGREQRVVEGGPGEGQKEKKRIIRSGEGWKRENERVLW